MDRKEINKRQRISRQVNGNACTRRYEKTKKGFLMRTYRNMKSRVEGIQVKKAHLYLGKEILDKQDFYEWALNDRDFNKLFDVWELEEYPRKLTPSIDRIESSGGYTLGNIRWLTHSENSSRGSRSRHGLPQL